MFPGFTQRAQRALADAHAAADELGSERLEPEHLLLAVLALDESVACRSIRRLGIDPLAVAERLRAGLVSRPRVAAPRELAFGEEAQRALRRALEEASTFGRSCPVGSEHLLLGVLRGQGLAARTLAEAGLDLERTRRAALQCADESLPSAAAASDPRPRMPAAPDVRDRSPRRQRAGVLTRLLLMLLPRI